MPPQPVEHLTDKDNRAIIFPVIETIKDARPPVQKALHKSVNTIVSAISLQDKMMLIPNPFNWRFTSCLFRMNSDYRQRFGQVFNVFGCLKNLNDPVPISSMSQTGIKLDCVVCDQLAGNEQ
jgi:hypothetical protein